MYVIQSSFIISIFGASIVWLLHRACCSRISWHMISSQPRFTILIRLLLFLLVWLSRSQLSFVIHEASFVVLAQTRMGGLSFAFQAVKKLLSESSATFLVLQSTASASRLTILAEWYNKLCSYPAWLKCCPDVLYSINMLIFFFT